MARSEEAELKSLDQRLDRLEKAALWIKAFLISTARAPIHGGNGENMLSGFVTPSVGFVVTPETPVDEERTIPLETILEQPVKQTTPDTVNPLEPELDLQVSVDLDKGDVKKIYVAEETVIPSRGNIVDQLVCGETQKSVLRDEKLNPHAQVHESTIVLTMPPDLPPPPDPPDPNRSKLGYAIKAKCGSESSVEKVNSNLNYGDGFMHMVIPSDSPEDPNFQLGGDAREISEISKSPSQLVSRFCHWTSKSLDGETQGRESITANIVAKLITELDADRVRACDLQSGCLRVHNMLITKIPKSWRFKFKLGATHGCSESKKSLLGALASMVYNAYQVPIYPSQRDSIYYLLVVQLIHTYGSEHQDSSGLDWKFVKKTFMEEAMAQNVAGKAGNIQETRPWAYFDMLDSYQIGERIGIFGDAGLGKTVFSVVLINNVAKAHDGFSVFAGVKEGTPEENDLYRELSESGVIKISKKLVPYGERYAWDPGGTWLEKANWENVRGMICVLATLDVVPVLSFYLGSPAEMVASLLDQNMRDHLLPKSNLLTNEGGFLSSFQHLLLCTFNRAELIAAVKDKECLVAQSYAKNRELYGKQVKGKADGYIWKEGLKKYNNDQELMNLPIYEFGRICRHIGRSLIWGRAASLHHELLAKKITTQYRMNDVLAGWTPKEIQVMQIEHRMGIEVLGRYHLPRPPDCFGSIDSKNATKGARQEGIFLASTNSGFFTTWIAEGKVKSVFLSQDHVSDITLPLSDRVTEFYLEDKVVLQAGSIDTNLKWIYWAYLGSFLFIFPLGLKPNYWSICTQQQAL